MSPETQSAIAFLCQSVCPRAYIYNVSLHEAPIVPRCYHGLRNFGEIQPFALSVFLYVLALVGIERANIDKLQRISMEEGIEEGGANLTKVEVVLKPEAHKSLCFRKLLFLIYQNLPRDNRTALIELTSASIQRNPTYTNCLFVHFLHLIQYSVISPNNIHLLHRCLQMIGDRETLLKLNTYCAEQGLNPLPTRST